MLACSDPYITCLDLLVLFVHVPFSTAQYVYVYVYVGADFGRQIDNP
jgi:hypothetical protein